MITYIEKGIGMHRAIAEAGHSLVERSGVWVSSDDVAVQAIIDAYLPLQDYKDEKKDAIKAEAVRRVSLVVPFIKDFDTLSYTREVWLSIVAGAKNPTPDFQSVIDIGTAATTAVNTVQTSSDETFVRQYDPLTDPLWP